MSPLQPTRGSGEHRELPQQGSGKAPAENEFWRILMATERSFLYLCDKNLRGTIRISIPLLQILGGELSPASPVIYAHVFKVMGSRTKLMQRRPLKSYELDYSQPLSGFELKLKHLHFSHFGDALIVSAKSLGQLCLSFG